MHVRRVLVLVLAVASLGGCGDDDGSSLDQAPDPAGDVLVACGTGGTTFPRTALETLREAPPPDDGMADGMEPFLGSEEGAFWPQQGWRVLFVSGLDAVLLADADSQLWFQTLELSSGAWRWTGSSATDECPLRVPAPVGYNPVVWRLDPEGAAPTPSSTAIDVLVHETACASGEPVGDRLVGPEVDVTEDEVRIGFLAETQRGDHTCPGNPDSSVTIQLEMPLGSRELVDAYDLGKDLREYL